MQLVQTKIHFFSLFLKFGALFRTNINLYVPGRELVSIRTV